MQYALRIGAITIIFCETLLNQWTAVSGQPAVNNGQWAPRPHDRKWVVVIDPGHGGKDPGCHGIIYKEKDVALKVSLQLGRYFEVNDTDVKLIFTRKTDIFVPLNERAEIANRHHADFFICIHCNANPDTSKFGAATYVMGLSKSGGNLEVAKRENQSILYEKDYKKTYNGFDPNSDEGNIIFALYQNTYLMASLDLAAKIQLEYAHGAKRTDNGVKQAGFLVLWKTDMPSLLTEIGFLTNPEEEKYIGSDSGQDEIAKCIFLAFEEYKSGVDEGTSIEIPNLTPQNPEIPGNDSIRDKGYGIRDKDTGSGIRDKDTVSHNPQTSNPTPNPLSLTPDSVIYKVQILTSHKLLSNNDSCFAGLTDVEMYMENSLYNYTAGRYSKKSDALKLQKKLRAQGFKDAFWVEFKGGKRVK